MKCSPACTFIAASNPDGTGEIEVFRLDVEKLYEMFSGAQMLGARFFKVRFYSNHVFRESYSSQIGCVGTMAIT